MKLIKMVSLVLFLCTGLSKIHAQDKPTLFLGGNISTFNSDTNDSEFLQSDFGFNLGYFAPLWKNEGFNIGLNIFTEYGSVNDGFEHLENRFIVLPRENTTSETSSNRINQSLFQLGIGPQLNYRIGNKFWISTILQGGYFNFNQDELIITQNIQFEEREVSQTFESDVLTQDAVSEGGLFFKPAVRLSFELTNQLSLWGEANFFMAQLNTRQSQLIPLGETQEQGAYFLDQITGSQDFSVVEKKQDLNGLGFSFGVAYSFGTSKSEAQDYNSSRSNKARRSNSSSSIAPEPDDKWRPTILCGDTDHFIHVGDCNDSDRQRTPEQSKAINNRLNRDTSVEKGQDNPLYDSDIKSSQNPLYTFTMNGGGNDEPVLCGNTNHLAHKGGDCDDTNGPVTPGATDNETGHSIKGYENYEPTSVNAPAAASDGDQYDTRNRSPYSISQVQEGVYIIYNSLISFEKRSKQSVPINTISDARTDTDSLQAKHTNPYFVSNELAGEMELKSNSGNNNNPVFKENVMAGEMVFSDAPSDEINQADFKTLIEFKGDNEINNYKYLFFKDGKTYYINLVPEKLERLFNQISTKGIINKATPCPPLSNLTAKCKLIDEFCYCKL